jgi:hypothetical protein
MHNSRIVISTRCFCHSSSSQVVGRLSPAWRASTFIRPQRQIQCFRLHPSTSRIKNEAHPCNLQLELTCLCHMRSRISLGFSLRGDPSATLRCGAATSLMALTTERICPFPITATSSKDIFISSRIGIGPNCARRRMQKPTAVDDS